MSIRSELKCKVFYFMGFIVFVIYFCCGKIIMFVFIGLVFVFFVVFELFRIIEEWRDRIKYCFLNMYFFFELGRSIEFIENYIEVIIRFYECERVVVYIYFVVVLFIVVYFFLMKVVVGVIIVVILGDVLVVIIGKSFGRYRFLSGKSFEGSLVYFFMVLLVLIFFVSFVFVLVGVVIGIIVEFYNVLFDDNFLN